MRLFHTTLLLFLFVLLIPFHSLASNLDYQLKILPNGVKLVYKVLPWSKTATARIIFPVGMLNEPQQLRGISHLLEHLIYRGNDKSTPAEFHRQIDEQGGSYNGMTTLNHTEYIMDLPSANLPGALNLFLDMLLHPGLSDSSITLEKKIVSVEKVLRSVPGDANFLYLNQLTEKKLDDSVNAISRDDLLHYHEQYYQPNLMTVIITGNFNPPEVTKILAAIPGGQKATEPPEWLYRESTNNVVLEDYLQGEEYEILFGFHLKQLNEKELVIAKILPFIFRFEAYKFDYISNRPLDYQISLLSLSSNYFLVFTYRDNKEKYTLEINNWHQKNLIRFCKYLTTKNFDKFLDWSAKDFEKTYEWNSYNSMSLNNLYANQFFEPSQISISDLSILNRISSNDLRNFVKKYLENKGYQKVVVKAL